LRLIWLRWTLDLPRCVAFLYTHTHTHTAPTHTYTPHCPVSSPSYFTYVTFGFGYVVWLVTVGSYTFTLVGWLPLDLHPSHIHLTLYLWSHLPSPVLPTYHTTPQPPLPTPFPLPIGSLVGPHIVDPFPAFLLTPPFLPLCPSLILCPSPVPSQHTLVYLLTGSPFPSPFLVPLPPPLVPCSPFCALCPWIIPLLCYFLYGFLPHYPLTYLPFYPLCLGFWTLPPITPTWFPTCLWFPCLYALGSSLNPSSHNPFLPLVTSLLQPAFLDLPLGPWVLAAGSPFLHPLLVTPPFPLCTPCPPPSRVLQPTAFPFWTIAQLCLPLGLLGFPCTLDCPFGCHMPFPHFPHPHTQHLFTLGCTQFPPHTCPTHIALGSLDPIIPFGLLLPGYLPYLGFPSHTLDYLHCLCSLCPSLPPHTQPFPWFPQPPWLDPIQPLYTHALDYIHPHIHHSSVDYAWLDRFCTILPGLVPIAFWIMSPPHPSPTFLPTPPLTAFPAFPTYYPTFSSLLWFWTFPLDHYHPPLGSQWTFYGPSSFLPLPFLPTTCLTLWVVCLVLPHSGLFLGFLPRCGPTPTCAIYPLVVPIPPCLPMCLPLAHTLPYLVCAQFLVVLVFYCTCPTFPCI